MMSETLPPHVELPTIVGPMLFPADDQVVTPYVRDHGNWEPAEAAALVGMIGPGDRVLDVGAHVGFLTLLCAGLAGPTGHVLAVEAAPANFALLAANVRRHAPDAVTVRHAAAWRETGTVTFGLSATNSGDHRAFAHSEAARTLTVPAVALDEVLAGERLDAVKLDAQGLDHVVVAGMTETLRRWRPVMLVEFWPPGIEEFGDDPAEVVASYVRLGYAASVLEVPGLGSQAPFDEIVAAARACPGEYCSLILHPRERRG